MTPVKSYGQVGYEAMLKRMHDRAPLTPTGNPFLDGAWEAQPQVLRDDWDAIGEAIATEHAYRNGR